MIDLHRSWWRVMLAAFAFLDILVVTLVLGLHTDPVRLALVVAVVATVVSLVLDATAVGASPWPRPTVVETPLRRTDPRSAALLGLLQAHLHAAAPTGALRERILELTDRSLRRRHDVDLDDPRARALLGPELTRLLDGPSDRLSHAVLKRLLDEVAAL